MVDPQARALLDLLAARGLPPVHTLAPPQAREAYALRGSLTRPEAPPVGQIREHRVDAAGGLRVRQYQPAQAAGTAPSLRPALIYLHGGGWTIGDLDTHDVVCRALCIGAGCVVLAVDYRLAPEARFPAAYDDSVAAFRWARAQAQALGIDPHRIAIGGDSAGGNLAAAACLGLAQDAVRPVFQLLIYPATDQRAGAPSHERNGSGYLLTREAIAWYRANYLPDERDWLDWRASPLLAPSHAGQPPALVLTAGFDPLRDEGLQYAEALSAAGAAAQYVCFERQIHGFITMGRWLRETQTALDLCAAALRRAFER
jgi:acetyl esterase